MLHREARDELAAWLQGQTSSRADLEVSGSFIENSHVWARTHACHQSSGGKESGKFKARLGCPARLALECIKSIKSLCHPLWFERLAPYCCAYKMRAYQMKATWALSLRQRESYASLGVSTGSFSPHIHSGISEDQLVPVFGVVFCP